MASPFAQTVRSRGFALLIHLGLWILLYLSITRLGGSAPEFREYEAAASATHPLPPVTKLDKLFSPAELPKPAALTNSLSPFHTTWFVPKTAPAPPPPTTRKIAVTYQGFYQAVDQTPRAMLKVADEFIVRSLGAAIVTNHFIAGAGMQTLTLTNHLGQTNLLKVNVTQELEIPIK